MSFSSKKVVSFHHLLFMANHLSNLLALYYDAMETLLSAMKFPLHRSTDQVRLVSGKLNVNSK